MDLQQNPFITTCTSSTINIEWQSQHGELNNYLVKYRAKNSQDVFAVKQTTENKTQMSNLKNGTLYEIKIVLEDINGDESSLIKTEVRTLASSAATLLENERKKKICDDPVIYRLLPDKNTKISDGIQIREFFSEVNNKEERSLLLLGARGSGKSTLVDAIINYVTDVSYADNFRFKITGDEMAQEEEDIVCYKIRCLDGFKVGFNLNVIDVPGFESRSNERIYNTLVSFFQSVQYIGAACLVVPSFCRLTEENRCIFNNILSIFAKDINCIIPLITFDDGGEIKALSSLRAAKVPFTENVQLRFNNSQLLLGKELMQVWDERQNSMNKLFGDPSYFVNCSADISSKVAKSRFELYQFLREVKCLKQQIEEKEKKVNEYVLRNAQQEYIKVSGRTNVDSKRICINCTLCKQTCIFDCSLKVQFLWYFVSFLEDIWSLICCLCSCCRCCSRSECLCTYLDCCCIKCLHRCIGCTCSCACMHHFKEDRIYSVIHTDDSEQEHENESLDDFNILNDDDKQQIEDEKQTLIIKVEDIYLNISRHAEYVEKNALFNELPEEIKNVRKF